MVKYFVLKYFLAKVILLLLFFSYFTVSCKSNSDKAFPLSGLYCVHVGTVALPTVRIQSCTRDAAKTVP